MSARKVLWIVLGLTALLWGGVLIFLWKPTPKPAITSLPKVATISPAVKVIPTTSPLSEDAYIIVKKSPALSSFLLTLTYEGALEKMAGEEWTIRDGNEILIFRVNVRTKFVKANKEIKRETVRVGDKLKVTLGLVTRPGYSREIEKRDLRNQNTLSVEVL
jgi:hypothetical protein